MKLRSLSRYSNTPVLRAVSLSLLVFNAGSGAPAAERLVEAPEAKAIPGLAFHAAAGLSLSEI